jgi:hypothetical protein
MAERRAAQLLASQTRWLVILYIGYPLAGFICLTAILLTHSTLPVRIFLVLTGTTIIGRLVLRWRTGPIKMMLTKQRNIAARAGAALVLVLLAGAAVSAFVAAVRM